MNPPFFFLHIPKTAGTSFREIVDSVFDVDGICQAYLYKDIIKLPKGGLRKYRLIRGHYGYEILRYYLGFDPALITMLRSPVERTISHLRFLKRARNLSAPLKQFVPVHDISIDELCFNDVTRKFLKNYQLKKLAYQYSPNMNDSERLMFSNLIEYPSLLPLAKSRIRASFFVGLAERFEDSINLFHYSFATKPHNKKIPMYNVAPRDKEMEPCRECIDSLAELLELDIELYNYAAKVFEERMDRMNGDPSSGR